MQRKEKQATGVIATTIAKDYKAKYKLVFLKYCLPFMCLKIFMINIPKKEKKRKALS